MRSLSTSPTAAPVMPPIGVERPLRFKLRGFAWALRSGFSITVKGQGVAFRGCYVISKGHESLGHVRFALVVFLVGGRG